MRPDQERVKNLLTDTVTLLCKNGLQFSKELKVQGLLGITTDDNDVFVVHINEKFGDAGESVLETTVRTPSQGSSVDLTDTDYKSLSRPGQGARKRRASRESAVGLGESHLNSSTQDSAALLSAKVKTERQEDAGLSSCESRPSGSQSMDDRSAMHETYSNLSLSDIQSGFAEFNPISGVALDGGGHPAKKRAAERGKSDAENSEDSMPGPTSWENSLGGISGESQQACLDLETAAQVRGLAWDPSALPPGADDSWTYRHQDMTSLALRTRNQNVRREFKCDHPGCDRSFSLKHNLQRHQTINHGREPSRKVSGRYDYLVPPARPGSQLTVGRHLTVGPQLNFRLPSLQASLSHTVECKAEEDQSQRPVFPQPQVRHPEAVRPCQELERSGSTGDRNGDAELSDEYNAGQELATKQAHDVTRTDVADMDTNPVL